MQIAKAVFPAAGLGTRFLPATKAQPKEMLPLVDKPLIQYVIEEAVASGIRNITIITGRGKNAIEDHFDVSYELEHVLELRGKQDQLNEVRQISNMINFSYVRQKEALGLGHAILVSRDAVGNEPFAVMLGDDIIDSEVPCLRQMMDLFEKLQASIIATCEVPKSEISHYGVIRGYPVDGFNGRVFRVQDVVEKPSAAEAPSNLAIIGRYILMPEIFGVLEKTASGKGNEIQLTDAIRLLLEQQPVYAYMFQGTRYDAGDKLGFLKATVEFALRRADLGAEFKQYLKSLKL
ncbi:MAG: UTP--glucose-1-phosphate uridylyltransferase [Acidobacteria bacterium 13_1_20CM_2_57_8]|nr:MAG: UTP--glucose-1-phosphate uridylyltransferase [Acidobacteria bacterium 13_1_20CM_2_57_8]